MAVTHADLERDPSKGLLGGWKGTVVMVLCTILGLVAFVLCLVAETTRSQVQWELVIPSGDNAKAVVMCIYTNNGSSPLGCAAGALVAVVVALATGQTFMGIALCHPPTRDTLRSSAPLVRSSLSASSLRWQAAGFFVMSWISFAVTAVLLLIGITVEADHLQDSGEPHSQCLVVRQGLFAAAGVFALASSSLGVAFYIAAMNTVRLEARSGDQVRLELYPRQHSSSAPQPSVLVLIDDTTTVPASRPPDNPQPGSYGVMMDNQKLETVILGYGS